MKNDKNKKILFYTMSMQKGGAERVIANICNYLVNTYDITIVCNVKDKSYYELNSNIRYVVVDDKIQNNIFKKIINKTSSKRTKKLKEIILNENPSLIISFLPEPSFRVLSLRKEINIPIIVSDRNDPKEEYKNFFVNKLMKNLYKKADGFVFQTDDAKSYFEKIVCCKSTVIPNPVSDKFIVEPYKYARRKVIVTVGRLTKQKNHKLLIDAFKKTLLLHPDYELNIYGDGELKNEISDYISTNNLDNKVILKGVTDDVKKEIYDASVFVLSSDYEGMPNVLMEAMAMGIPCVSTNCSGGGAKFLIENNVDGILVPVNNTEAMSDAINKIIENMDLSKKLSENASKKCKKFNNDNICRKWEDFLKNY